MNGQLIKRLASNIDVSKFISQIEAHPELWRENTWRQDYVVEGERPISPQKDTEAVMFRWAPRNTIESVRDSLDIVDHPNLDKFPEVKSLVMQCLEKCGAVGLGRIFITKLKPGGVVIPHCDFGLYSDHFERFHLVLTSEPGNEFFVQDHSGLGEFSYMKPGEFFWFNHKEAHWALNKSVQPRMHLIIDAVAPEYRRERANV